MKEQFVNHELSLRLRNIGFNEDCIGYFVGKDKDILLIDELVPKTNFKLNSKIAFRAPLWQQAFDWFLDEYKYWQFTFPNIHSKDWSYHIQYYDVNNYWGESFIKGGFKNKKQARLECLKKLIEIVENKIKIL